MDELEYELATSEQIAVLPLPAGGVLWEGKVYRPRLIERYPWSPKELVFVEEKEDE